MKKNGLLSLLMSVILILSMLPSMVFAGELVTLEGELKVKGDAEIGSTLSADYTGVEPSGVTDEMVSFLWERKISDDETKEIGKEKTYQVTEEDLGYVLILTVTGLESQGYTGSLKAKTEAVTEQKSGEEDEAGNGDETQAAEENTEEEAYYGEGYYEDPAEYPETEYEEDGSEQLTETIPEEGGELRELTEEEMAELNGDSGYEEIIEETEDWMNEESSAEDEDWQMDWEVQEEVYGESQPGEEESIEDPYEEAVPYEEEEEDLAGEGAGESQDSGQDGAEAPQVPVEPQTLTFTSEDGAFNSATVTITNPFDTEEITVILPEPDGFFEVSSLQESTVLAPGASLSVFVQPLAGAEVPAESVLTFGIQRGNETSWIDVAVTVSGTEEPAPVYDVVCTPQALDFGTVEEGYASVEAQSLVITNNGNQSVVLNDPVTDNFSVEGLAAEGAELAPGASLELQIAPRAELAAGIYVETLQFASEEAYKVSAEVTLTVTEAAPAPVYALECAPETLDFGSAEEGYAAPEAQKITITNTGNQPILLTVPESETYSISGNTDESLEPAGAAELTIAPAEGLEAGNYDDVLVFTGDGDTEVSVEVKFTVTEAPVYSLSCDTEILDFGAAEEGYATAPKAKWIHIINDGNQPIHLETPSNDYFKVGKLAADTLEPGDSMAVAIRPRTGLKKGKYESAVKFPNAEGVELSVDANFSVTENVVKLQKIQTISPITDVPNNAEKSVKGLKLPATVKITTTNGEMNASVKWDVEGCAYDPRSVEKQSFTVNGTVVLPEGVKNPDGISLNIAAAVEVGAYTPRLASASDNKITGITVEDKYTPQAKISFTAVGAGMDNDSPRKGDTRYIPLNWTVINTNTWQSAPYTATFGMAQSGEYTLTVVFNQQQYDGTSWANTGSQDTKKVVFNVAKNSNISGTPTPVPNKANQKAAVQTGDDTNILPFVIALVLALVCVVGIIVYRKKK